MVSRASRLRKTISGIRVVIARGEAKRIAKAISRLPNCSSDLKIESRCPTRSVARPRCGPGPMRCAYRVCVSAHSSHDPIAQELMCSSPGARGNAARLRRTLSLPRSRVPLLNRSRRCTRLACPFGSLCSRSPGAISRGDARSRTLVGKLVGCLFAPLCVYVFAKAKRTSGKGSDFVSSIQP